MNFNFEKLFSAIASGIGNEIIFIDNLIYKIADQMVQRIFTNHYGWLNELQENVIILQ